MRLTLAQALSWCEQNEWQLTAKAEALFKVALRECPALDEGDLRSAERLVEAEKFDARSATRIAVAAANLHGCDVRAVAAAEQREENEGDKRGSELVRNMHHTQSEFRRAAQYFEQQGIKAMGKSAFMRAKKEYDAAQSEPDVRKREKMLADIDARQREGYTTKPDKFEIGRACVQMLGAPNEQMQHIVATDGALCTFGQNEDGKRLALDDTRPLATVHAWAIHGNRTPNCLVLQGACATGKTTAACWLLYHMAKQSNLRNDPGQGTRLTSFVSGYKLARIAKSNYEGDMRALENFSRVRTLIIDSLLDQRSLAPELLVALRGALLDILEQRGNRGLSTVLTTNHIYPHISRDYGPPIASYFSSPRGTWVDCGKVELQGGPQNRLDNALAERRAMQQSRPLPPTADLGSIQLGARK